jgi:uncharacterized protein
MPRSEAPVAATTDADIARLQDLLSRLPPPLDPPDISTLDGFLCGVLVQPNAVPPTQWQVYACDLDGRPPPPGVDVAGPMAIARRRHRELDRAIGARRWFDPWILAPEPAGDFGDALRPWVAGFALALGRFGGLLALDRPDLREPLAMLYRHLPGQDLELDAELTDLIESSEPVKTLDEAVEDLVCAVLLLADIGRPLPPAPPGSFGPRSAAAPWRGARNRAR